ncbi:PREDICTED: putative phytosulfokines 6 [Nelumbo nucifera]|uniref:Phytosulfokine n=1 Tax=Nelumbo nucifera TaxID=4432 RepID=A0A1U7YTQ3_NELNU|nr:PREDICTED: putative phytosulfokines 6 [Nelumbo nucifera]
MTKTFQSRGLLLLFLLFILLSFSAINARLLEGKQGNKDVKDNGVFNRDLMLETVEEDALNLMGMEKCDNADEECLKRRKTSEAHLDYIYTQHHKP